MYSRTPFFYKRTYSGIPSTEEYVETNDPEELLKKGIPNFTERQEAYLLNRLSDYFEGHHVYLFENTNSTDSYLYVNVVDMNGVSVKYDSAELDLFIQRLMYKEFKDFYSPTDDYLTEYKWLVFKNNRFTKNELNWLGLSEKMYESFAGNSIEYIREYNSKLYDIDLTEYYSKYLLENLGLYRYHLGYDYDTYYNLSRLCEDEHFYSDGYLYSKRPIDKDWLLYQPVNFKERYDGIFAYNTLDLYRGKVFSDREYAVKRKEVKYLNMDLGLVQCLCDKYMIDAKLIVKNDLVYNIPDDPMESCKFPKFFEDFKLEGYFFLTNNPMVYFFHRKYSLKNFRGLWYYKTPDNTRNPNYEEEVAFLCRNMDRKGYFVHEIPHEEASHEFGLVRELCEILDWKYTEKDRFFSIKGSKDYFLINLLRIKLGKGITDFIDEPKSISLDRFDLGDLIFTETSEGTQVNIKYEGRLIEFGVSNDSDIMKRWRNGEYLNEWAKMYYSRKGRLSSWFKKRE